MKRLLTTALLLSAVPFAQAESCDRVSRNSTVGAVPTSITAAPNQFTEVVFPEKLEGILPEVREGLTYNQNHLSDRLYFQTTADYNGLVLLHGRSGKSYRLHIQGVDSCADSTVTLVQPNENQFVPQKLKQPAKRALMEFMLGGEKPPGYSVEYFEADQQPVVLKQGSVFFYPYALYQGYNYTGFVLRAVNAGRTPFHVAIEMIDFNDPALMSKFGSIKEISMLPSDRRLAPAPEYASDAYTTPHEGLVFLVAHRSEQARGAY